VRRVFQAQQAGSARICLHLPSSGPRGGRFDAKAATGGRNPDGAHCFPHAGD
jgi:hypothetical protein